MSREKRGEEREKMRGNSHLHARVMLTREEWRDGKPKARRMRHCEL